MRKSWRSATVHRRGEDFSGPVPHAESRRTDDRYLRELRDGQPEYASDQQSLRGLPSGGGAALGRATGDSLHPRIDD